MRTNCPIADSWTFGRFMVDDEDVAAMLKSQPPAIRGLAEGRSPSFADVMDAYARGFYRGADWMKWKMRGEKKVRKSKKYV